MLTLTKQLPAIFGVFSYSVKVTCTFIRGFLVIFYCYYVTVSALRLPNKNVKLIFVGYAKLHPTTAQTKECSYLKLLVERDEKRRYNFVLQFLYFGMRTILLYPTSEMIKIYMEAHVFVRNRCPKKVASLSLFAFVCNPRQHKQENDYMGGRYIPFLCTPFIFIPLLKLSKFPVQNLPFLS